MTTATRSKIRCKSGIFGVAGEVGDGKLTKVVHGRSVISHGRLFGRLKHSEMPSLAVRVNPCSPAATPVSMDTTKARGFVGLDSVPLLLGPVGPSQVASSVVPRVVVNMVNLHAWCRRLSHYQAMHALGSPVDTTFHIPLAPKPVVLQNQLGIFGINHRRFAAGQGDQYRAILSKDSRSYDARPVASCRAVLIDFSLMVGARKRLAALLASKLVEHLDLLCRVPRRGRSNVARHSRAFLNFTKTLVTMPFLGRKVAE